MNANIILLIFIIYFLVLLFISNLTSKKSTFTDFFNANRSSPWYLVAFGMIGTSLSGVTFISVPGEVGSSNFSYFQVVLGYLVGYYVIAKVLLPLYYKHNLISIYTYLEDRFGFYSYKAGAFFFLLSRTIGASFRLFLVAGVLQIAIFNQLGLPYFFSVLLTILLIWIYTFKGGIKTIVWTDALQTLFMLSAVIITIVIITDKMNISLYESFHMVKNSSYSNIFYFDWRAGNDFFKQFISGAFIAIVMTGLDQDMMQKNLTCKSLAEAKKNMVVFSFILVLVTLVFLVLGSLLFIYSSQTGISIPFLNGSESTDLLFPEIALNSDLGLTMGIVFLLGLIAAAYSSADSALTSLTTSFCVDFLDISKKDDKTQKNIRIKTHIAMSLILAIVIILYKNLLNTNVIDGLLTVAGYTYGPLLGLFAFGIFTKYKINDKLSLAVCIISVIIVMFIGRIPSEYIGGYVIGYELLPLNGLITFIGLFLIRKSPSN